MPRNRWAPRAVRSCCTSSCLRRCQEILTGMRIAIGFGWTTLVAAELVAATVGLGQLVMNASNFLRTDIVLMGILVIGIVAWIFDLGMRRVEQHFVPWKGRV